MTQQQYVIQRKLSILELGSKLGNISEACRRMGVSRQHFYDLKSAVEEKGIEFTRNSKIQQKPKQP